MAQTKAELGLIILFASLKNLSETGFEAFALILRLKKMVAFLFDMFLSILSGTPSFDVLLSASKAKRVFVCQLLLERQRVCEF